MRGSTYGTGHTMMATRTDDSQTYIGLVAGTIRKCDVEGCSVSGYSSNKSPSAFIEIEHKGSNVYGWGILIGWASDSNIKGMINPKNPEIVTPTYVEGITFTTTSRSSSWSSDISIGALLGKAEQNVNLSDCSTSNVSVGQASWPRIEPLSSEGWWEIMKIR